MKAFAPLGIACVGSLSAACMGAQAIPDPRAAAEAWADAADRGDAEALHGMLTKRSRATISKSDVAATVASAKAELKDQAKEIRDAKGIVAVAILRWDDGTEASLVLENGRFRVRNAVLMPGGGTRPEEAIAGFRDALRRRSYPALLRMLTPALRAAVEAQLKGIESAIGDPEKLPIPSDAGDEVEIKLENGHKLRLKRIDKTWYIDNFE
ncbi:MAG: hypothetical protein HYV09_22485 [Deltaproteobacteria bacterium]|nr:hypothetical protein [Deltaproteobacteria bacterium]